MRRIPWEILLALVVGIGIGLVYAWLIAPRKVMDADPSTLRADFKEQYRSAIAAAYAATSNLPRAEARLYLLKDVDPAKALNAQAQQMLARGDSAKTAAQVAALAQVLVQGEEQAIPSSNPVTPVVNRVEATDTPPVSSPLPELTFVETGTPVELAVTVTESAFPASTPHPSRTPVPTQGTPFKLAGRDEVCDPNLPDGLLQVMVLGSSRKQLPGMEIDITWANGEEKFFTGLKPVQGNGYADFVMDPQISYSVQLAAGSETAAGLVAPICQNPGGENYYGGVKLTFQQP